MCDDFGSDSGGFDDVGSSDFDSDIGSDFDSDISSDFDSDFSADIDSMDFDDVDSVDFDSDISDDFDSSDFSDDFDDVETIDFDDDISSDIDSMDFDDDIETLVIDDDIDTLGIDDDIETIDIEDDIETLDFEDDMESLNIEEDIETLDIEDDIETLDIDDDIETIDIEVSEFNEEVEDTNMDNISEDTFEIDDADFGESDMESIADEADFEAELAEMEEMTEAMEAESSDFDNDTEAMEFDDEAEAMDVSEEFEDIAEINSDDISEDFDFDSEMEDIDISEDIEAMDLDDGVEEENNIDGSFDNIDEVAVNSEDVLEEALIDLEADNGEIGDIPTYTDADEVNEAPEAIDWDSMLSDGDRDYIQGIMNNDNYTPEQKDFLVQEALGEIYERETAEPEYGARVRALTYDGNDIITRPPEDYNADPYIDEVLLTDALNSENLTSENLGNLRDYLDTVSNDDSLTNDEKSFLINQALGSMSDTNGVSYDTFSNPSNFEGIKEANAPEEIAESINDSTVNEYNEPFSGELSEQDIDTVYEGFNEYDFHGVDCLENPERLDASLENFTSENWENLSIDEQKEQMTDLAQYIIDVTGLENPPKIEFYNSGKDGDYGGFNRATNTLSINEHMLYQNDEAADTVAHELWHAYQYERASNPSTKLDHMYLENFNDYITPDDDFEGYQSQILESEARAFAQQIKNRLNSY